VRKISLITIKDRFTRGMLAGFVGASIWGLSMATIVHMLDNKVKQ